MTFLLCILYIKHFMRFIVLKKLVNLLKLWKKIGVKEKPRNYKSYIVNTEHNVNCLSRLLTWLKLFLNWVWECQMFIWAIIFSMNLLEWKFSRPNWRKGTAENNKIIQTVTEIFLGLWIPQNKCFQIALPFVFWKTTYFHKNIVQSNFISMTMFLLP